MVVPFIVIDLINNGILRSFFYRVVKKERETGGERERERERGGGEREKERERKRESTITLRPLLSSGWNQLNSGGDCVECCLEAVKCHICST